MHVPNPVIRSSPRYFVVNSLLDSHSGYFANPIILFWSVEGYFIPNKEHEPRFLATLVS